MNVEMINESINYVKDIALKKHAKIVEGDVLVPDIKPDILTLVNVENEVYIKSYNVTKDNVSVNGVMELNVLYISEDDNGSIKSLSNSFEFSENFDIDGVDENSLVMISIRKGNIETKITNARKLNVKASIDIVVEAKNKCVQNVASDVTDNRNIEFMTDDVQMQSLYNCKKEKVEIKENINLDEENLSIGEILKASIKIINEDYKVSYNKVLAKADAVVKIIYVADDNANTIESFETTIPIMSFVDFDGIDEKMNIELSYMINSFFVRPIYQDMKATSFNVDSNVEVTVCAYKNENLKIISDIYSTDAEVKCEHVDIEITEQIINHSDEIELVQGLMIPELENIKILDIKAVPNISNKNVLDEKIAIEGLINFDVLYYNESKKILENKKMDLPFAQVIKIPNLKNGMEADVKIDVKKIEYKKVDINQLQVKIILNVNVLSKKNGNINAINEIEISESESKDMPSIIIYYVKKDDSLWKIAKKFKTTVNEIKEFNELTSDIIYPGDRLLIPKKAKKNIQELL